VFLYDDEICPRKDEIYMLEKNRIRIIRKLGESLAAEVFLAKDENRAESVIVKKIRPEFAQDGMKEYLEQHLAYLRQLNIRQLIIPDLQIDNGGVLFLISPCCKGRIFSEWLAKHKKFNTKKVLEIGIALAHCLALRHRGLLIHKGVKPGNILIQDNPVRIRLIDDVRISDNSHFSRFVQTDQYTRGTLPYLAPEQTGRIRLNPAYTSDLYALGTILYECVTGNPPFISHDPLAIIYSHLAEVPPPASELNSDCPAIISDIIAILLEKTPERRYQSAAGLAADLQTCLTSWQKTEHGAFSAFIPFFILKQKDQSNQITIPSIMVGRNQQKTRLMDEYQRVCTGKLGTASISGLSGMGKTRLIQELERPIVAQRGYYTFGKFNQYNRHVPYSTLIEALGRLMRQLLTEDAERMAYWRKHILNGAGENGQLLVEMVPELERLIGRQPEVAPLPPVEAKNRFNNLFCRFLASLACAQHPLVLFIDDMQWCDNATFDLLDLVVSRPGDFPYLFIIGAHRNNEVDEDHRVIQLERKIEASDQPLLKLYIDSLGQHSVNEMISFVLNASTSCTQKLTDIIHPISAGNPLFVNESLRWLHNNNRLLLSENGTWIWDTDDLTDLQLPVSAKALFYDKLKDFPAGVISILSIAAMLGVRFEVKDLALVTQRPQQELYPLLHYVFAQRVLLQDKTTLFFSHDQIQAAAASFLNDEEKQRCHGQIARVFIDELQKKENQKNTTDLSVARLFSLVEHLTAAHTDEADEAELYEEAQFNYLAGVAAMDILALEACDHYLSRSAKLCYDSLWQTDYDFMFPLYKKLARAALVNGDQKRSSETINMLLEHAETNLDRAECLYEQTVACASMGDVRGSIDLARRALNLIGIFLPLSEDEAQSELSSLVKELHQNNRDVWQKIADAPLLRGRRAILEFNLYGEILPSLYGSGQVSMCILMAFRGIKFALQEGVRDLICYFVSVASFYFQQSEYSHFENYYEDLLLKIVKRFPDTFGAVKAMVSSLWTSFHLKYSVPHLVKLCRESMDSALKCGELHYAGLAHCSLVWFEFVQGKQLLRVQDTIEALISFSRINNIAFPLTLGEALQISFAPLCSTDFDESTIAARLKSWKEQESVVALGCYFVFKGIVAYYNHQYFQAEESLGKGEAYLEGVTNTIVYRLWYLFGYLVDLQRGKKTGTDEYLRKVTDWAAQGPILRPYLAFMQAEVMALQGNLSKTRNIYLDAIDIAHNEQYLFLEAFLNERLGQYLEKENHFSAKTYMDSAILLYQDCGAPGKVVQMNKAGVQLHTAAAASETTLEELFDQQPDTRFLISATHAIMQEKDYNLLLQKILSSAMERLGAKTGYLLLYEKNDLLLCAKGKKNIVVKTEIYGERETTAENFCMEIARYAVRLQKPLVIDDAVKEGDFVHYQDVLKYQLKSILCIPLINQNLVLGVLYLENGLIPGVFTRGQVELISMLTAQAAIALEHNLLVAQLRDREQKLSTTLDSIGDGVIVTDASGIINRVNPVAEVITGWPKKEALGRSVEAVFQVFDASTKKPVPNPVKKALATGETVYLTNHITLIAKNGAHRQIIDSAAPIYSGNDRVEGVVLVFNDVTETYRLRQQVAKSHMELQQVVGGMKSMVGILTPNGTLTFVNKMPLDVAGLTERDVLGKKLWDCPWGTHKDSVRKYIYDSCLLAAKGIESSSDIEFFTIKGAVWIEFSIHPVFDEQKRVVMLVAEGRDITARRQAEQQLARSQKMDAMGKLTGGIAHDYNNMLGVMLGYAELLEIIAEDQSKVAEYAQQIIRAGVRGTKLTKKLLSFSREKQAEAGAADINGLILEMRMMLEKTLTARISLELDLCSDLWPVWIDPGELEDVIFNMSINAMHAMHGMESTGTLRLKTSMEYFATMDADRLQLPSGDYVLLSILDSGMGMDKETQNQMFDPFFTTKGEKGTGLGLSQVYGFIKRSKGAVDVYSSPGEGTRFVLYFPRYLPDKNFQHLTDVPGSEQSWQGTENILVVDDEPALAELTCEILNHYGYNAFSAESGAEALEILKKETVDLMISDVIMPGMNGYQLAAEVERIFPSVKIQMISGFADNLHKDFSDQQLYTQMLVKPVNSLTLLKRVRELLDGKYKLSYK